MLHVSMGFLVWRERCRAWSAWLPSLDGVPAALTWSPQCSVPSISVGFWRCVLACGLPAKFCGCILQHVYVWICVTWAWKLPTQACALTGPTKVNKSTAHYFQRYSFKLIKTQSGTWTWIAVVENIIDLQFLTEEADGINQYWIFHLFSCSTNYTTIVKDRVDQLLQQTIFGIGKC